MLLSEQCACQGVTQFHYLLTTGELQLLKCPGQILHWVAVLLQECLLRSLMWCFKISALTMLSKIVVNIITISTYIYHHRNACQNFCNIVLDNFQIKYIHIDLYANYTAHTQHFLVSVYKIFGSSGVLQTLPFRQLPPYVIFS